MPVATVTVSLASSSINVGATTQATATTRDASNNVLTGRATSWSSSNTGVATVSPSGLVTAVAVGTAQITAASEGQSGSGTRTVTSAPPVPVASVSVALAPSSRNPGETTQATATTRDANNNVLTGRSIGWSSSNASIATVSGSGLVTAVAVGTAQITATSEGQAGSATLTVAPAPPVPVASVSVALAASSQNPGQTTQATATTRDANNNVLTGRVITWSSSNTGVATVSGSGLVTAIAVGTVQIIAACEGQSGSATLTVASPPPPAPVASVSVALGNSSLNPGLTTQATATTRDANNNVLTGRAIAWSSSNTALATVSGSGLVTAIAVGPVQITATSESQTGSATLSVQAPPPPPPPGSSNEPAGMTVISERAFNALNEDPAWTDYNSPSIAQDATAPKSPSNVWHATYPTGFAGGSSPAAAWLGENNPFSYRTVYVSWWAKHSSNWYGNPTGTNKHVYVLANRTVWSVYFTAQAQGTGPIVPSMESQNWIVGGWNPPDQLLSPNLVPSARITRGQWFHIELVLVGNTAGTANGSVDWYMDGVHIGSYSGVQFTTGAALWTTMNLAPVWGGAEGIVPATQTLDIDHFYMSGKN